MLRAVVLALALLLSTGAAATTFRLSWTFPTQNVDGSAIPATGLLSLKEYVLYQRCGYPPDLQPWLEIGRVAHPGSQLLGTFGLDGYACQWCATAVNQQGQESQKSNTVGKEVPPPGSPVVDAVLTFPSVAPQPGGLLFRNYNGTFTVLPDFSTLTPIATGRVPFFTLAPRTQVRDNFAMEYTGQILVTAGSWRFFTTSDDGSRLYIDSVLRVNNDGLHSAQEVGSTTFALTGGLHTIRVEFFERTGAEVLEVRWLGPGVAKQIIPASALFP